jgi:hypothetical protein
LLAFVALVTGMVVSTPIAISAKEGPIKKAAKGELRAPTIKVGTTSKKLPFFSSGLLQAAQEGGGRARAASAPQGSIAISPGSLGCSNRNANANVRVNQDCGYRRQAEEVIAVNPIDPNNLIAGQNDSRIGWNHCGADYSFDGGHTWGDQLPPFWQRLNWNPADHTVAGGDPAIRTYDAASDPGVAFDSQGRAFFTCVVFDVNDYANAILVASSPPGAGGSFYNNVPDGTPLDPTDPKSPPFSDYVVVEDNTPFIAHDKEFIAADSYPSSPYHDNVYVTWTVFKFGCGPTHKGFCSNAIYFSRSTNHAVSWSAPKEISGVAPKLCFFGNFFDPRQDQHACNFDQGSEPIVRPNGDIVVIFTNGNTPADNPNGQQLAVISKDGGDHWSRPVKVGDDIVLGEPTCDFGRGPEECIPGAFVRTNDFPRIAVNRGNGNLYATWQDYRTGAFDIQLATSTDGGKTWTHADAPVNPTDGKDHYFPAIGVVTSSSNQDGNDSETSDRVGVSYFRTDRVPNENPAPGVSGVFAPTDSGVETEPSDYSLAGGRGLNTRYTAIQVSPTFLPPDGGQEGFNGDYSGLVLVGTTAHPIWSDTRSVAPSGQGATRDEDVFTDSVALPGT